MSKLKMLFAVAVLCLSPAVATAQAPASPALLTSPADQTAAEMGRAFLEGVDMLGRMERELPKALLEEMKTEPGFQAAWEPLLSEALVEELRSMLPSLYLQYGRQMSTGMTQAEQQAGLALLKTKYFQSSLKAVAQGAPAPAAGGDAAEVQKIMQSPAGRGFSQKLRSVAEKDEAFRASVLERLLPGAIERFERKLQAAPGS
jgi:hypothetical protein